MPCCMLGAMFLGQCLAVWAWIRRRLGFAEEVEGAKRGLRAAFGRRPKMLALIVCIELLLGGALLLHSENEYGQHAEHASELEQTLTNLKASAVCRAKDPAALRS